jgi:hypothetical protein
MDTQSGIIKQAIELGLKIKNMEDEIRGIDFQIEMLKKTREQIEFLLSKLWDAEGKLKRGA